MRFVQHFSIFFEKHRILLDYVGRTKCANNSLKMISHSKIWTFDRLYQVQEANRVAEKLNCVNFAAPLHYLEKRRYFCICIRNCTTTELQGTTFRFGSLRLKARDVSGVITLCLQENLLSYKRCFPFGRVDYRCRTSRVLWFHHSPHVNYEFC